MLVDRTKFVPYGDIIILEHRDLFLLLIVQIAIESMKPDKNFIG